MLIHTHSIVYPIIMEEADFKHGELNKVGGGLGAEELAHGLSNVTRFIKNFGASVTMIFRVSGVIILGSFCLLTLGGCSSRKVERVRI